MAAMETHAKALAGSAAQAAFMRGERCLENGRYDKAAKEYTEAIRLDPGCAAARSGRGAAYAGLERYDNAVNDFNEAIRLDPGFTSFYIGRALTGIVSALARSGQIKDGA